jgi:hypothetical protein
MDDSHNASPSFPRVHLAPPGAARVHQLQHMFQVAVACPNRDQPRQVPPRRGKSDQRMASGQHVVIWSDIQHLAASGNVCQEGGIAGYLEPWSGPPEGPQTICRFADAYHLRSTSYLIKRSVVGTNEAMRGIVMSRRISRGRESHLITVDGGWGEKFVRVRGLVGLAANSRGQSPAGR